MQLLDLPAEGQPARRRHARQVSLGGVARRHRHLHLRPARHPPSLLQDLRLRALCRGNRLGGETMVVVNLRCAEDLDLSTLKIIQFDGASL
jgi:hypothetical protein